MLDLATKSPFLSANVPPSKLVVDKIFTPHQQFTKALIDDADVTTSFMDRVVRKETVVAAQSDIQQYFAKKTSNAILRQKLDTFFQAVWSICKIK